MVLERLIRDAYSDVFAKTASKNVDAVEVKKVSQSLMKLSGLQYKPEVYEAICGIIKIASETIDNLYAAFESERTKINEMEKTSQVRELIDEMIESGIVSKDEAQEKVAILLKKSDKQLEVVREAMKLASNGLMSSFDSDPASPSIQQNKQGMFDAVINS